MSDHPGKFIVLEGTEGAGKSSCLAPLRARIEAAGHAVQTTREPGGTAFGEAIRAVLMADHGEPIPPLSELLLMFAARAAHLRQVIEPALARGEWVLCDRFVDASYAYQGGGRELGLAVVTSLEALVLEGRQPDRVLWFDLPVAQGLERVRRRGTSNRFDAEELAFHQRVREVYAARAGSAPERYRRIDAAADAASVRAQVASALEDWL